MTTFPLVAAALGVAGSLVWISLLAYMARHRRKMIFLADQSEDTPASGWPTVAVIFAARDEAAMVAQATRSMLAQDYPDLEVIAVDDRSVDDTGAILDAIAREVDTLRVVHVRDLPAGWLGKTHALQAGSEATEARWILFTDADVVFGAGALRRAIAFAEANALDHLTIGPEIPTETVGERLFLALFGLLFAIHSPVGRLDDRRSKAHMGIGAFNLVRAESFRAIAGFRHLALSVDDDMRLGQALKFAGYRMRCLLGLGLVSVRWQVGLGGMIRGIEKNFFGALNYQMMPVLIVAAGLVVVGIAPYAGLFVGPIWSRVVCGMGIAAIATTLAATSKHSRIGWTYALLIPVAAMALLMALLRSVVVTLWQGGVRWRGHLYPLRELKAHVKRRDAWLREVWRSTR